MTDRIARFQPSPATSFWLEADVVETQATWGQHGRWRLRFYLRAANGPGGNASSSYNGPGDQVGLSNATEVIRRSGNPFLPAGFADNQQRWRVGPSDSWREANANGFWNGTSTAMPVVMDLSYGSVNLRLTGSLPIPRISRLPSAAGVPRVSNMTPSTATLTTTAPSAPGNAALIYYQFQVSTDAGHTHQVTAPVTSGPTDLNLTVTGLNPGQQYFTRARARNGDGWGAWSANTTFTPLPAVAPGMTVTPSPSGMTATVALTPPGGTTGVTGWQIQYRLKGTTNATTIALTAPTSSYVIGGLTPGQTYEYRSMARIGEYDSPWTDWLEKRQPNPNTNPGDYFDGSTVPEAGSKALYAWDAVGPPTGTAPNNAISRASLPVVQGWTTFAGGSGSSGGTGVVTQVAGGAELPNGMQAGTFAARVVFFSDATAAGFTVGQSSTDPGRSDAQEDVLYVGGIYVFLPNRQQRLAAEFTWRDAAGNIIGQTLGASVLVPVGTWTRVVATATSPDLTRYAAIRVKDVTGDGWGLWRGGDVMELDAAQITVGQTFSYFDGSFPNDGSYHYAWQGTAHASTTIRTELVIPPEDPLIDPLCPPVPAPPRAPIVQDECIEDVPTWRRYWYQIPATEVSDWLTELPTIIISSGNGGVPEDPRGARQIQIRIFPNPFSYAPEEIDRDSYCSEQIISYMPPYTTLTLDGPLQRVFAEVSGGNVRSADHLLYGTGGVPPTWPQLSCGIPYLLAVDEPLESPAGNIAARLLLTRRT